MAGQRFTFGSFVLNAETGTLLNAGEPVPVGYRAFRLLTALVTQPGEVLTKAVLMDAAWEGATIEEANLSVQVAVLRKHLGSSPSGTDWITTIPRVGYRFVGEVERGDSAAPLSAVAAATPDAGPSIAVLPFANLGADPDQEYFADGMVEDIITGLSRLRWLFVIARNSTFAYKGRAADVRQVATDLGVRYVLEGSVRRSGDRLRVTSQLIDAATGAQIWADRYDRAVRDVFALQDEITDSVIASIEPQLYAAEHRRFSSRPPDSLDAWGHVMRAMPLVWTWSETDSGAAIEELNRAVAIEPGYARAHSLLAWTYASGAHMGWWLSEPTVARDLALEAARRSIERDGEDPWSHLALGYVHLHSRSPRQAAEELEEAIWLNPNFALAHAAMGATLGFAGSGEAGLEHLGLAARLSPRDPHQALYLSASGLCHFVCGRYDETIAFNRRAVQQRPRFASAWRTLAAAAGLSGDLETAKGALAENRRLQPELSLDWVERNHPIVRPEDRRLYLDGLKLAGLT